MSSRFKRIIWGFDPGQKLGWAVVQEAGRGSFKLLGRGVADGHDFRALRRLPYQLLATGGFEPELVAVEVPYLSYGRRPQFSVGVSAGRLEMALYLALPHLTLLEVPYELWAAEIVGGLSAAKRDFAYRVYFGEEGASEHERDAALLAVWAARAAAVYGLEALKRRRNVRVWEVRHEGVSGL